MTAMLRGVIDTAATTPEVGAASPESRFSDTPANHNQYR
jgi:hypothetical protein